MKRVLAIIMVLCMVFAVAACGESSTGKKGTASAKIKDDYKGEFRAGYAKTSIEPDDSLPLAGFGNTMLRMSDGFVSELFARCTAVSDEDDNTALVFNIDLINIRQEIDDAIKEEINKQTGIPQDNILINCTHTHAAPDISQTSYGPIVAYTTWLQKQVVAVALKALNDRKPAKMYYSAIETERLTFVRLYKATGNPEVNNGGDYCLSDNHYSVFGNGYATGHLTESNDNLYLIKYARDDAKDIYWGSFRMHPTAAGSHNGPDISADFPGIFCDKMEEELDCECLYLQGAAGNHSHSSRIEGETIYNNFIAQGEALAKYGVDAAKNMKQLKAGKIRGTSKVLTCNTKKSDLYLLPQANLVQAYFKKYNDDTSTQKYAISLGLASQYHASSIINRSKAPATKQLPVYALAIGELGIPAAPVEQFDNTSTFLLENSPFEYTIPLGYSNGSFGYVPDEYSYSWGSYESDNCTWEKGVAEQMGDAELELIKKLYKDK